MKTSAMARAAPPAAARSSTPPKVIFASLVGSAIEWFDYFLFGTLAAIVFSKLYFPSDDPAVGVMLAYLSFALTFFIRPLGGILFSHFGDRVGRKRTLAITLSLMGIATVGMGLLPTYEQIGILAPILVVFLRLLQGIGIGGQWGSSLLIAYEHAPKGRKGLFGSLPQAGVTLGMLLSTVSVSLVSLLPEEAFLSWGWRLPFLFSIVLVFISHWVRKHIEETPDFVAVQEQQPKSEPHPLITTLTVHWRPLLTAIFAKFVETAPFYIFTVFVVSYATGILQYDRLTVLNAVTIGAALSALTIPCVGWMSDRIGRRPIYLLGCVVMAAFAFPYFLLLGQGTAIAVILATAIAMGVVWPLVTAVLGTMFSELFGARVRYTGITLGYQIGAALAGGTAPLIATWLLTWGDNDWRPIALLIVATSLVSGVSILVGPRPTKSET